MSEARAVNERISTGLSWRVRGLLVLFLAIAAAVIWTTNVFLTERYTASTRSRAEVRQALFVGSLLSELRRSSVVTLLLSRDPILIGALSTDDFSRTSQHVIEIKDETGIDSIMLLDGSGRTVAATDRNLIGSSHRSEPYFISAQRSNNTEFATVVREGGTTEFMHSRRVEAGSSLVGVIVVGSNLRRFEQAWASFFDAALVTDSEGQVILATESRWRGSSKEEALAAVSSQSEIARSFREVADWTSIPPAGLTGRGTLMMVEQRIPFHGWRMMGFTTYVGVREPVNTVLALETMLFAILLAGGFYLSNRNALMRSVALQRESDELRLLNEQLRLEMGERKRAQKNLEVAEQTITQSSKLAALGEMSASVSHELNQPLAAMKTYLAGVRKLLKRRRLPEVGENVERIDELIERMATITGQLRSYAREGNDAITPTDARDSVSSAISLMDPLIKERNVTLTCDLPVEPVIVMAGRVRLVQVLVNLLRNAIDATKLQEDATIGVVVSADGNASIAVSDNGSGIENLDSLFEPFYTTKGPGEGTGLGLAISSDIVRDLKGRLIARNRETGGAVFEVHLPLAEGVEVAG